MTKRYVVVGFPTTGGGEVISGNKNFLINGKAIACVGDEATCPTHNTAAFIMTGDSATQFGGMPVAREGDLLSCGCTLLLPSTE
ncbi:PAAR domain-containing protein [Acinetobacter sp. C32I]|uniref:PAAR domain-containing protein n=1 Tax=Acinetobacter sp. C32I TaxID=2950074 RepID=UPI00203679BB|nr:PAAR domain-containing protein [Acinetobacter sp. C32I]USA54232.1 PAAR domain-containing protein [Acinetobacter sp. C32I]